MQQMQEEQESLFDSNLSGAVFTVNQESRDGDGGNNLSSPNWIGELGEEARERVFAVMTTLRERADAIVSNARQGGPRNGSIVYLGSRDVFDELPAQAIYGFLRELNNGKNPDEAKQIAANELRAAVVKWNEHTSKGRAFVANSSESQMWPEHGQDVLESAWRKVVNAS